MDIVILYSKKIKRFYYGNFSIMRQHNTITYDH